MSRNRNRLSLQVKIWFQNRRMKWKRSKKAQQEAKSGHRDRDNNSSGTSGTTKDNRSSRSHSCSSSLSGDDEKSGKSSLNTLEKGYPSIQHPPPLNAPAIAPPPQHHSHSIPPARIYSSGTTTDMDYSTVAELEKSKYENNNNNNGEVAATTALLMKRPPLFFPEDVSGEMFRPYVS